MGDWLDLSIIILGRTFSFSYMVHFPFYNG